MDFFGDFAVIWTFSPIKLFHLGHYIMDKRGPYFRNRVYFLNDLKDTEK